MRRNRRRPHSSASAFCLTYISAILMTLELVIVNFNRITPVYLIRGFKNMREPALILLERFMSGFESDGSKFTELPKLGDGLPMGEPVPLNRMSFSISSCPKNRKMMKNFLKWWATSHTSQMVTAENQVQTKVWWQSENVTSIPPGMNIMLINESNYHLKWALLAFADFDISDPDVDWYIVLDDDTIPMVDTISKFLGSYDRPREEMYFMHGPGERVSRNRLGNGGGGFYMSRALVEKVRDDIEPCIRGMARRVLNGDIRLDTCLRRSMNRWPEFIPGMFHLDPKVLRGNLTGLVEGYMTRVGLVAFHHVVKVKLRLFPMWFLPGVARKDFVPQIGHFLSAAGICGSNFLSRHIMYVRGRYVVLNEGYTVVVFPSKAQLSDVIEYISGVEVTFRITGPAYFELERLYIPQNLDVTRYYMKYVTEFDSGIEQVYTLTDKWETELVVRRSASGVYFINPDCL